MNSFAARLGNHNLTRLWWLSALPNQSALQGFLTPPSTTILVNRGAKEDCGINWVRPIEPPSISKAKSGDQEGLPFVPTEQIIPELQQSKVLKKVSPTVQKMYMFEYLPKEKRKAMMQTALIDRVKRHNWDDNSPEVIVALMTANIRRMQEHIEHSNRDSRSRVILKELIEKRKKRLKLMRSYDYKRFEWLLERLNLVYYPTLSIVTQAARSISMQALADDFGQRIKDNRLAAYREELEYKKPDFLKRKLETMRAIMQDEKSLKVSPTFTEEDILEVEKAYKEKVEELSKIVKTVDEVFL